MDRRQLVGALLLASLATVGVGQAQTNREPTRTSETNYRVRSGRESFERWCLVCHGTTASNSAGTRSLQNKYKGSKPALLTERTDLTEGYIEFVVRDRLSPMIPFRKTEITDAELALLAQYLARK